MGLGFLDLLRVDFLPIVGIEEFGNLNRISIRFRLLRLYGTSLYWGLTLSCGYVREDEFDIDLEDIMVMEAIWLSIQVRSSSTGPLLWSGTSSLQSVFLIRSHFVILRKPN